jgi:O-antigen/teichoic acid export membrane protein
VLYIVALGGWRALNAEPFMIRYAARPEQLPGPARRSLGATFLFGVIAGAACVLASAWAATPYRAPLLVLGATLPFLLLQDTARVMSFTMFRMRAAAANDGLWAGLLVLALGALALFETSAPAWLYLAAWGVTGAVAGLVLLRQLRLGLDLRVASPDMRENFRLGLPLLANYLLTSAPVYLLFLITPAVAGLAELGLLRAAYVPFGLFGVLLQGMQLVALPYAMRMPTPSAVVRLARRLSIGLAGVAALWGVMVMLLPASIGSWLIGDLWGPTQTTRALFAVAVVGDALITGPLLALRALRAPGRLVRVRLVSGPTTLVLGLVLLPVLGADGVALASIAGSATTLVLAVIEVRRTVGQSPLESAPETPGLLPGSPT